MNWTPSTIFAARDRGEVLTRGGHRWRVRLYHPDGWAIAAAPAGSAGTAPDRLAGGPDLAGLDVWTACRVLNDAEAQVAPPEEPEEARPAYRATRKEQRWGRRPGSAGWGRRRRG
jgi:hypothetical protein